MSWFSLFKSSDKAMDAVTGVAKGGMEMLDEAFYTDQEKEENRQAIFANWLEGQKLFNQQTSPTARSRRLVVWGVTALVAYGVVLCSLLIVFDPMSEVKVNAIMQVYAVMQIGWAFVGAVSFYFGPHMLSFLKGGDK